MWIFKIDVEFTVTCDSQLITCPTSAPAPTPVFSMLVLPSVPPPPAYFLSQMETLLHLTLSLASAPSPMHPVFDMNSSLCLGPVDFLSWLHLETNPNPKARLALTERKLYQSGTISERSWEKTMWPGKRMKKFPITVLAKILPLWGDPLRDTHTRTHTMRFLHYLVKGRSLEINAAFSCLLIFLLFGLSWWHSGWETTS